VNGNELKAVDDATYASGVWAITVRAKPGQAVQGCFDMTGTRILVHPQG
jgi:hypothetical protein